MRIKVGPGDGTDLHDRFDVRIMVRGEYTAGVMAVIEETVPPHTLISPHVHANDVWVHVLSGEIGALVADEIVEAEAGSWVLKPRDVPHAMWNGGDDPARVIEVLTPAGSERWFEELADLPPGQSFEETCERYGIRFLTDSPWTRILRERYRLD